MEEGESGDSANAFNPHRKLILFNAAIIKQTFSDHSVFCSIRNGPSSGF